MIIMNKSSLKGGLKMNKKGKTSMVLPSILIISLLLGAVAVYGVFFREQSVAAPGSPAAIAAGGCQINPSVVNSVTDELTPGTTVGASSNYRLNKVFIGTTAPTTVGTADILFNASGYISKIKTGQDINCGSNQVIDTMQAFTNASLTYYSNNGLTSLTQSSVNETVASAGGSYNWKLHFQGVDKKSSGKQLVIVELSVPANVSSVTLGNGAVSVTVPNGYSRQLTNGYAAAFTIPAVVGNNVADYNLAVAAATGKVVSGQVYTTVISTEPFVETDGTFSDEGKAYDSVNTAKFHDSQTKNFIIA